MAGKQTFIQDFYSLYKYSKLNLTGILFNHINQIPQPDVFG